MKEIEFYSYNDEVWYRRGNGVPEVFDEHNREIIDTIFETIKSEYPDAFEALRERYGSSEPNIMYYKYVVVKRFIKCNFSKVDTTYIDIENLGGKEQMNSENVDCPLRGECPFEGRICNPRFSSNLTEREMMVAKYFYEGKRKDEIAELMFLSPETVNNHIRRIYKKLDVHSEAEFVKYVDAKRMFKNEKK